MADPIATPEAPKVTNQEALHMHNEGVATAGITADHLAKIKAWREQSKDPRDVVKNVAEGKLTVSFSSEQTNDLKKSFGAGQVDTNGEFTGDAASVEGQLYAEAKSVIEGIAKFQKYSEILADAARTGKSAADVAQEKGVPDLVALREEALAIMSDKLLTEIDPELTQVGDADAMRNIVDERLAKDPAFRREVNTLLSQIKRPKTEVATNVEAAELTTKISGLETRKGEAGTEIKNYLERIMNGSGIDLPTALPDGIDKLVSDYVSRPNATPEGVLNNLEYELGTLFGDQYAEYNEFLAQKKSVDELKQRYLKIDESKNKDAYDHAKSDYEQLIADLKFEDTVTKMDGDNYKKIATLKATLSPNKTNGIFTSQVAQRVQELTATKKLLEELSTNKSKSETTSGQAISKTKDERIAEERLAISELRGVIPRAIATTLLDRAKKADTALAKDYANKFDADTKGLLDRVQQTKLVRGLGYRENGMRGQRLNDREIIVGDARALALNKENGLRELMLKYTGLFNENKLDDNNQPIMLNGETQKIRSYDDLNARQKVMFDKAYAAEAQSVKMKVARDLVASQSFMDRLKDKLPGKEKNGLNDTEWEEFGKFYQGNLDQIINSSKEGQEALNALRAAGIKPESSKGIKILTWIALILGGGLTIASLGGLASVIPALAGTGLAGIKAVAVGAGDPSSIVSGVGSIPSKGL